MHSKIKLTFNNVYYYGGVYYFKNNGWMIFKNNITQIPSINIPYFEQLAKSILAYKKFCDDNQIFCYIEIAPRKIEFMKDKTFRIVPQEEQDVAALFVQYMKEKYQYNIVYPLEEFKKADENDFVFFKTDHHWTDWGAYNGYKSLMENIKEQFPEVKTLEEDEHNIFYKNEVRAEYKHQFGKGSHCYTLKLENCPLNINYKYYTHKQEKQLLIKTNDELQNKDFYASYAPNKQSVMIIGNSFSENIAYFFASTFQKVSKRRANNSKEDNIKLSRWKNEIIEKHPDILIIIIHSGYMYKLIDLKD